MGLQILGAGAGSLITHPSADPIACKPLRQRLAMPCRKGLQAAPPFQLPWEIDGAYLKPCLPREAADPAACRVTVAAFDRADWEQLVGSTVGDYFAEIVSSIETIFKLNYFISERLSVITERIDAERR